MQLDDTIGKDSDGRGRERAKGESEWQIYSGCTAFAVENARSIGILADECECAAGPPCSLQETLGESYKRKSEKDHTRQHLG